MQGYDDKGDKNINRKRFWTKIGEIYLVRSNGLFQLLLKITILLKKISSNKLWTSLTEMQKINSFGTGRKILVLTFLRAGDWTLDEKLKSKNI